MTPGWRIIDCTGLDGSLAYKRGQLVVTNDNRTTELPLNQLAVVLIGMHTTVSGATLAKLSDYDVAVLVCDWKNIPVAGAYPWHDHTRIGARHRAQAELPQPKRKQAWAKIVNAKIRGQANAATLITGKRQKELYALAPSVRSGDSTNIEAQAARLYWSVITSDFEFRRQPGHGLDPYNSALDYGYTILRGIGIRAITSAGLAGSLGIFHRGRSNTFNLVDDLMEPFRPLVDHTVFTRLGILEELTKEAKYMLAESLTTFPFDDEGKTVSTAFEELAQAFGGYIEGTKAQFEPKPWKGKLSATNRE